jgi:hypothetical protein
MLLVKLSIDFFIQKTVPSISNVPSVRDFHKTPASLYLISTPTNQAHELGPEV